MANVGGSWLAVVHSCLFLSVPEILQLLLCCSIPIASTTIGGESLGKRGVEDQEKEVRGHEKKHQGKVVRSQWMWCLRPVCQETTSRQQASRSVTGMCLSCSSKLL